MAVIEQEPMLTKVKASLGITGSFHDETLKIYLYEVLCFLDDAGVSEAILKGDEIIGLVSRGVADLWNYGNGGTRLSDYFMMRASQLALKSQRGE